MPAPKPVVFASVAAGMRPARSRVVGESRSSGFEFCCDQIRSVVTSQGQISADQICVTSGAWTGLLLQKLGLTLGVVPVRGQIVLFHGEQPAAKCVINEGSRYLVPREDGRLLAGSTEEEVGFDK